MDSDVMKRFIFSACLVGATFGFLSCEKHNWDKTKTLYEHGDHGEEGSQGEDHGSEEHE